MRDTVELIVGEVPNVHILSTTRDETEPIAVRARRLLEGFDPADAVYILTDVMGGSVNNEMITLLPEFPQATLLCGTNACLALNLAFLFGIAPTLDRLYPDDKDPQQLAHKKEAYQRHMAFYNCTPQTSAFTLGLAASMEEQYAADRENFNPDTINAVKTSLMGPLSGVGDSFFQGTIRIIAFGLGIQLAQQGSILGPILAMLISFVPSFVVTWFAGKLGYTMGSKYLTKLQGGMMDQLRSCRCRFRRRRGRCRRPAWSPASGGSGRSAPGVPASPGRGANS